MYVFFYHKYYINEKINMIILKLINRYLKE